MDNKTFSWRLSRKLSTLCCGLAALSVLAGLSGCQRSGAPAPVEWGYKQVPAYTSPRLQPQLRPQVFVRSYASSSKPQQSVTKPTVKVEKTTDIQILDIQNGKEKVLLSQRMSKALGEDKIKAGDLEIVELKEGQETLLESSSKAEPQTAKSSGASSSASEEMPGVPRPSEKPTKGSVVLDPLPQAKSEPVERRVVEKSSEGGIPAPSQKPARTREPDRKITREKKPLPPAKPRREKVLLNQAPYEVEAPKTEPSQGARAEEGSLFLEEPVSEAPPLLPKTTAEKVLSPANQDSPKSMAASSAPFSWPLRGKILKGFSKSGAGKRNDGLNIEGALGEPVRAARQGQVVYVGNELHGFGHLILVKHDDEWMSAYAHLGKVHVQRGDYVKRGQAIGTVGSSGSVSHPQLHFEVRRHSQPVDPRRFLE